MKKFLASVMAVAMMATMSLAASAIDFTASSALNNDIVVDGEKDLAYVSAAIPVNAEAPAEAAVGNCYAAWDDDYLYLYLEVTDAAVEDVAAVTGIWSDDCAEFYINLSGEEGAITDINALTYAVHILGVNGAAASCKVFLCASVSWVGDKIGKIPVIRKNYKPLGVHIQAAYGENSFILWHKLHYCFFSVPVLHCGNVALRLIKQYVNVAILCGEGYSHTVEFHHVCRKDRYALPCNHFAVYVHAALLYKLLTAAP